NDGLEAVGVAERDLGQGLAVQVDALLLEAGHEHAVAHAVHARGGIDALDPQTAILALLQAATDEGVLQALLDGVLRDRPHVLAAAEVPLGPLEHLLAACAAGDLVLTAWHCLSGFWARAFPRGGPFGAARPGERYLFLPGELRVLL